MKAAEVPHDDDERLAALRSYGVLDTPPEEQFDALTRLAAKIVGVPISLVSLIDVDRQWFKSRYGLDAPETPRDVSFCGHAVAERAPLIVEDARVDPRFADNPLVLGAPNVTFYAGFPLETPDGFVLGTLCTIDSVPHTLTDDQREALSLLAGQVVQLLELRRTAQKLEIERRATAEHRAFFELGIDLFCTTHADLHFDKLNPAWTSVLGYSLDELRARPFTDFVITEDVERTRTEAARLFGTQQPTLAFENQYRHRDGRPVTLSWRAQVDGERIYAAARDVTEERARSRALDEQRDQLAALFDGMNDGVVMQLRGGAIVANNRAAEHILGLDSEQLRGRTSVDPRWRAVRDDGSPYPGELHPAMVALTTGEAVSNAVMGVHKPSGELTWISINARPLFHADEPTPYAAITTFRDITDERRMKALEARVERHQRLVTTGTLAAGVGHEINNPLAYILSNAELALEEIRELSGGSPSGRLRAMREMITDVRDGAHRIGRIVRGLKALAREEGPLVPTDVRAVLEMSVHMGAHELRPKATLLTEYDDVPPVIADESRLAQVFVNLIVNAAQAFTDAAPSVNRLRLALRHDDASVIVEVSDNGPGIPADVLPRIFDPFFTTKPVNVGTGLGLSISHSIVTALGGSIEVDTEHTRGTTFTVRLPIAEGVEAGSTAEVGRERRGQVFVVDDDEIVLRSVRRILEREHEVVTFADPRVARDAIAAGARPDVIFCDLMMPHIDGLALHRLVATRDAALARRFVFISGGVLDDELRRALASTGAERLDKPFSSEAARALARRIIDEE